jgi:ABC-type transporter Mla maintaining outer membrane lipid asymmetry ATPase subunit MlaF
VLDNLREAAPDITDGGAEQALERVGLGGTACRDARELSGGEAQRMGIARTLLTEPEIVLFDEPTSSLDPGASMSIEAIALDLATAGTPSVWVTHDLDQMQRLAHHLIVVIDGTIAQEGNLDDVLDQPIPEVQQFLAGTQRW